MDTGGHFCKGSTQMGCQLLAKFLGATGIAIIIGLAPLHIEELGEAKHIFSHVEWHMKGYRIRVDELEKSCSEKMLFVHPEEVEKEFPIPAAFEKYVKYVNVKIGQEKYEE